MLTVITLKTMTVMLVILLALATFGTSVGNHTDESIIESGERRLINKLLDRYRKLGVIGRPVLNTSDPVNVEFGLGLVQMDLREKDNVMMMSAWSRYQWRDEYLTWTPGDYDGVQTIRLPSHLIWNPDIMLYNTASTTVYTRTALAVISFNGLINWYPHRIFESSCSIDVKYFPFDNQTCVMNFGSWTHTVSEINVSLAFPTGIDLSTLDAEYNSTTKWEILSVEAERLTPFPNYAVLTFTLKLKRNSMFSSYILTVPAVFLSFLTLVVFALPSDDVEKSQLGLAIFGSLLLLLLIVVEASPPTAADVPLLGLFYCFTTVIVILSVFLTAVVVKVGHLGTDGRHRPIPKILRKIMISGLGTLLCVNKTYFRMTTNRPKITDFTDSESIVASNGYPPTNGCVMTSHLGKCSSVNANHGCSSLCDDVHEHILAISATLSAMSKRQKEKLTQDELDKSFEREWRMLAAVIDRLFFWIYLVAIVLSTMFLFPW